MPGWAKRSLGALLRPVDRLDAWLGRLGMAGATVGLTLFAIAAAEIVHFALGCYEQGPFRATILANIALETVIVAMPIIYYSRRVIGKLARSQDQLTAARDELRAIADRAEGSSRAKSAFIANMSHELRTPLNAIMGFAEVMKGQHLGPVHNARYLSYAADIHASGSHLLGIINDILDLSKIEAGKMSLESAEEFALHSTIETSVTILAPLAEKFGVTLKADIPGRDRLFAVERMVQQIVLNLVGNAIKFTPEGGSVRIMGAATPDGGGYVLTVEDSGVGMSEEEIARALTPFGQVANAMSGRHAGTGLGLPLAKAMIDLHGGSLEISSVPKQGTIVRLNFPQERVVRRQAAAA